MLVTCGLLDAWANALFLVATRHGMLTVVAALGALYPAATLMLARTALGERLARAQFGGVCPGGRRGGAGRRRLRRTAGAVRCVAAPLPGSRTPYTSQRGGPAVASDGKMDDARGRAKRAAGELTDDDDLRNEGKVDQASGKVKSKVGEAADKVKGLFDKRA